MTTSDLMGRERVCPPALTGIPMLEDLRDLSGARVLVRTDFNVPLQTNADGTVEVADSFRIRTALPTLEWLQAQGASVSVCSHLGRPDGLRDERWNMEPVRRRLMELAPGVELMENLRFFPGEKANDPEFVRELVKGFDAYVNDAFGVSHRSHASIVGPPLTLPSAAGRRLAEEVRVLCGLLSTPSHPFVAVVGGAKIGDKLGLLRSLAQKVDFLIIGGAMSFTFMAAMGHEVGASLVDLDHIEECRQLLRNYEKIMLPSDVVALEPGYTFGPDACRQGPCGATKVLERDIPDGWQGLDIGPDSAQAFSKIIESASTVLWNGPMGAFEDERFSAGTAAIAHAVASCAGHSVVGGGDSARALEQLDLVKSIDFLSTGGGASLELLEHGDLPALKALRSAKNAPSMNQHKIPKT